MELPLSTSIRPNGQRGLQKMWCLENEGSFFLFSDETSFPALV